MSLSYQTFDVLYQSNLEGSSTTRQNRAVITMYGSGELKAKAEIERQRPEERNVVVLDMKQR